MRRCGSVRNICYDSFVLYKVRYVCYASCREHLSLRRDASLTMRDGDNEQKSKLQ